MKAKSTSALYVDSDYDAGIHKVCSYANGEITVIKTSPDEDAAYKILHKHAKNYNGLYRAGGIYSTDIYVDESKITDIRAVDNDDELTARDLFFKVVITCDGRYFTALYCSTLSNANNYCRLLAKRFNLKEEK